ncbi:hypothetical protein G6F32_017335 [Rhizopus arrhizus]|nr:hypothetical protein G6F32_017335 [Rhizopus arrhizus]
MAICLAHHSTAPGACPLSCRTCCNETTDLSRRRPRRVIHVKPPVMLLRWPSLAASRDVAMGAGDGP